MDKEKGYLKLKGLMLIFASLVFAFGVLATSVWKTSAQTQDLNFKAGQVLPANVLPTSQVQVNYPLPYPGILPDNTLYPLKMLRDKILLFFTFDSLKKSEVLLLYADKRIGAAKALIEGGKQELGVSTLTKAEKYLEQAITQAEKAKKEGKDTKDLYEKLTKAILKHQEILNDLLSRVSGNAKETVQKAMEYPRQGYETVTKSEE